MQEKIGFSFILTNYNAERYIGEAIRSVFNQVYDGPMELIVVDDCSTDNSWNVIQETIKQFAGDFDVKCVKTPQNGGTANSVDTGMALAKYDWLVMIDGDDVQLPDRSEYTAGLIREYPEVQMVTMAARKIGPNGEEWGFKHPVFSGPEDTHPDMLYLESPQQRFENCLVEQGKEKVIYFQGVIRRSLYERWGRLAVGEMSSVHFYQDISWGMRAALSGPVLASSRESTLYRYHGGNQYALTMDASDSPVGRVMAAERLRDRVWPGMSRTFGSIVQSCERALKSPILSDLSEEQIEQVLVGWKRLRRAYFMMESWWQQNWFVRVFRVLRYGWRVRPVHLRMALWRLLPLKLFCYMKSKKNG